MTGSVKTFKIVGNDISDGYHTFDELYEHRISLFLRLCEETPYKKHYRLDYPKWVCVFLELPEGQISYHVPARHLERVMKFASFTNENIWDGHTSERVLLRLDGINL
jgi:hypothetical protein